MPRDYPFSSHNGITIANVFILLFSHLNDNYDFHGMIIIIYYYYYCINCLILYFVCKFFVVPFYVLTLTLKLASVLLSLQADKQELNRID
jgi:hypothetical protein